MIDKLLLVCEFVMSKIIPGIPESLLIISGIVFLFLIWWLPNHIERLREHGGNGCSALFGPGTGSVKEALGEASRALTTAFAVLSAILVAVVALPSPEMKSALSTILTTITLIIFSIGLIIALYLSLIRPLSGTAPSAKNVYLLSRLLLLGLGFTMFALASIV